MRWVTYGLARKMVSTGNGPAAHRVRRRGGRWPRLVGRGAWIRPGPSRCRAGAGNRRTWGGGRRGLRRARRGAAPPLRVLREQIPSPGEGGGCGFVAGEEEREGLVADLGIGHGLPVFVTGSKQHGEEIAGIVAGLAPAGDDAVNDVVELAARAAEAAGDGEQRQAHDVLAHWEHEEIEHLEDLGEGVLDGGGCVVHLGAEESIGDDAEREPHHLLVELERLARLPMGRGALRLLHHRIGIAGQALAVEGWLHELALAGMAGLLAGETFRRGYGRDGACGS